MENLGDMFELALKRLPRAKTDLHEISGDLDLPGAESFHVKFEASREYGLPYGGLGRAFILCLNTLVYQNRSSQINFQDIAEALNLKSENDLAKLYDQFMRWKFTKVTITFKGKSQTISPFM